MLMRLQHPQIIAVTLLFLLLACAPWNRLQDFNRKSRVLATGVATIGEGNYSVFEAYERLGQLSNYRIESRTTIRDNNDASSTLTTTSDHDEHGNIYILTQAPNGQPNEIYFVDGHTYVFEAQYKGWVDLGADTVTKAQETSYGYLVGFGQTENPLQWLSKFGAVPIEAGQEIIDNRAATRYELKYVAAKLTETFGNQAENSTTDLQGTLWIDNQTGALLKSEIFFYDNDVKQPSWEFSLEIHKIGNITPIVLPSPIVHPETVVSATATAQAWSVLQVEFDYQGTRSALELVPMQISPVTDSTTSNAALKLLLRQLPSNFSLETDTELLLAQLNQRLSLSIPKHNLVVTSNGYQVEEINLQNRSVEVLYLFDVDLEEFSHVELIVSSPGNPLLAPVPVVGDK